MAQTKVRHLVGEPRQDARAEDEDGHDGPVIPQGRDAGDVELPQLGRGEEALDDGNREHEVSGVLLHRVLANRVFGELLHAGHERDDDLHGDGRRDDGPDADVEEGDAAAEDGAVAPAPPRGRRDGDDGVDKLAEHVPSHLRAGRGGEVLHRELRAQAYEHDVEERVQHAPSPVVGDLLLHILERVLLLLQLAPG